MDIQSISSDDNDNKDFDDDHTEDDDGDHVEDDDGDYVDDDDYVEDNNGDDVEDIDGDDVEDNDGDDVEDNNGDDVEDNDGDYVDDGHGEYVDDDDDYVDDASEYLKELGQMETNGTAASSNAVTEEILDQFKKWLQGILGFHVMSQDFPNMDVGHICAPPECEIYDNSKPALYSSCILWSVL